MTSSLVTYCIFYNHLVLVGVRKTIEWEIICQYIQVQYPNEQGCRQLKMYSIFLLQATR